MDRASKPMTMSELSLALDQRSANARKKIHAPVNELGVFESIVDLTRTVSDVLADLSKRVAALEDANKKRSS